MKTKISELKYVTGTSTAKRNPSNVQNAERASANPEL